MFDSRSFHAAGPTGEIRDDLAFKIAAQLSSKKVHDFLGAKAQGAVAEQFWIEFGKMLTAFEKDAGRQFALSGDPVVLRVLQNVLELGCDELGILVENLRPLQIGESIREALRPSHVLNPKQCIVEFGIANAVGLQLPCEPFVPVQIDLDRHRKPGLNTRISKSNGM